MSRILVLHEKAKSQRKRIILPEGEDWRVVKAASVIAKEKIADVLLLGKKDAVLALAKENSVSLDNVQLVDPLAFEKKDEIIEQFYEKRKYKGVTPEEAEKTVLGNFVFYAAMMIRMGYADGFVAGASHTTSDVARAALYCFQLDREVGTVSSAFIMEIENCPYGEKGLFAYADCGIIPYPTKRQLMGITISTSDLFRKLFGVEPKVALLSYSTKGSAEGDSIVTIREALAMIKEKRPDILVDGELQVDSALVPEVAKLKCPNSKVAGSANVLIFPNLDAGNISYKLSQRLANARAVGPVILGLDKPCSDLSRGCSWEDVVDTTAVTAIRAQGL
ncbi:MAG: phosphate acetyltransferase [Candidatus Omnitrophica bacterium]|nr:phosphate acetyltransferase [Candidatus Omnitrophota bacterium]